MAVCFVVQFVRRTVLICRRFVDYLVCFRVASVALDCVVVDDCGLTPLQCTHFDLTLLA
jgi:hypothetical protein